MDDLTFHINYRLYNGVPANNYYTKIIDGKMIYYDEYLNKLDDESILQLGLNTLTVINDYPTNITDFYVSDVEKSQQKGSGKTIVGSGLEIVPDDQRDGIINNFIALIRKETKVGALDIIISKLNKITVITKPIANAFLKQIFSQNYKSILSTISNNRIDEGNIQNAASFISDLKNTKTNRNFKDEELTTAEVVQYKINMLIDYLEFIRTAKKKETGKDGKEVEVFLVQLKAPPEGQEIKEEDYQNIDLSEIKPIFTNRGIIENRGYIIENSKYTPDNAPIIERLNYEVNLFKPEIVVNVDNDITSNNKNDFQRFLKVIYPLLIQTNKFYDITHSTIIENNDKVFNHLINTPVKIYDKYILDKSFLDKTFKSDSEADQEKEDEKRTKITIISKISQQYIKTDKTGYFQKCMYFWNKAVRCLNTNCYRPARSGAKATTTKQRQECQECTDYRQIVYARGPGNEEPIDDNLIPEGVKIKFKKENDIFRISCKIVKIKLIYEKFCYNNFNESYWKDMKGILYERGKVRNVDPLIFSPDIINRPAISYLTKQGIKKELSTYQIERNGVMVDVPYKCELQLPWDSYPNDIIEIDHISGNHKDNRAENIQPLCKMCHAVKTYLAQDKATSGSTIAGIDAYFTNLLKISKADEVEKGEESKKEPENWVKICGFFYLQYVVFCKKHGFNDTMIGLKTNLTTDLMDIKYSIIDEVAASADPVTPSNDNVVNVNVDVPVPINNPVVATPPPVAAPPPTPPPKAASQAAPKAAPKAAPPPAVNKEKAVNALNDAKKNIIEKFKEKITKNEKEILNDVKDITDLNKFKYLLTIRHDDNTSFDETINLLNEFARDNKYGILQYERGRDAIKAVDEKRDKKGNIVVAARPAVSRIEAVNLSNIFDNLYSQIVKKRS
jgi:hypothetical protein